MYLSLSSDLVFVLGQILVRGVFGLLIGLIDRILFVCIFKLPLRMFGNFGGRLFHVQLEVLLLIEPNVRVRPKAHCERVDVRPYRCRKLKQNTLSHLELLSTSQ